MASTHEGSLIIFSAILLPVLTAIFKVSKYTKYKMSHETYSFILLFFSLIFLTYPGWLATYNDVYQRRVYEITSLLSWTCLSLFLGYLSLALFNYYDIYIKKRFDKKHQELKEKSEKLQLEQLKAQESVNAQLLELADQLTKNSELLENKNKLLEYKNKLIKQNVELKNRLQKYLEKKKSDL